MRAAAAAAAVAQVVNKAIAAELIFVATTNFDQVRPVGLTVPRP